MQNTFLNVLQLHFSVIKDCSEELVGAVACSAALKDSTENGLVSPGCTFHFSVVKHLISNDVIL